MQPDLIKWSGTKASLHQVRLHYLLNVIPMLPMGTKTVSFPESESPHKAEGKAERQLATCDAVLVSKGIKASSASKLAMTWLETSCR